MSDTELYDGLDPDTHPLMERFGEQLFKAEDLSLPEASYGQLFDKYEPEFQEALETILDMWDSPQHRETLGHDNVHISYDMLEFLYLTRGVEIKTSEKRLTLFGALLHDLGRYPELLMSERSEGMDFSKGRQIQLHAALSGLLGAQLARKFAQDEDDPVIKEASRAFNRRVIGAALYHGGKNETRDIVAHHVQSLDRLAGILGSREFVRNIIADGVQRGAAIYPDESLSYSDTFPLFNNLPVADFEGATSPEDSWTNVVHYIEMPMRNMFDLSTEFGMQRAKHMKRESGIILTLLTGGPDSELYRQTFAPELDDSSVNYQFPKTKLPLDVWEAIEQGPNEEEMSVMSSLDEISDEDLINIMLDQQAPDITDKDRAETHELLATVPSAHHDDLRRTIQYVVARRELNRREELKFIEECMGSEDPLISDLAKRLHKHPIFNSSALPLAT